MWHHTVLYVMSTCSTVLCVMWHQLCCMLCHIYSDLCCMLCHTLTSTLLYIMSHLLWSLSCLCVLLCCVSCHINCVVCHVTSTLLFVMSTCSTVLYVMSTCSIWMSFDVVLKKDSPLTCEWVTAHTWMSQISHVNESCHTCSSTRTCK